MMMSLDSGLNCPEKDVLNPTNPLEELEAVVKPPRKSSVVIGELADEEIPVQKYVGKEKQSYRKRGFVNKKI